MRLVLALSLVAACAPQREEADRHYKKGIELLAAGRMAAARDELRVATRLGAMDPALYLPLARACRDRGLSERAVEFYRKYLAT